MKNHSIFIFKLTFFKYIELFILMLCSIIGAGFISGSEVYEFFIKDKNSYLGLFVFFILVFIFIFKVLYESKNENLLNIKYVKISTLKNIKNKLKEFVIFINVLLISGAMFSGLKFLVKDLYNNNYIFLYLLLLLVIFIILYFGIKWLSKFDIVVVIFILFIVIYSLAKINISDVIMNDISSSFKISPKFFKTILFAILYVFMNFMQIKPLIETSKIRLENKKKCLIFSFIFSLVLTMILLTIIIVLKSNVDLISLKMPLLFYFSKESVFIKNLFCFGLLFSLISTLLSSLISVTKKLKNVLHFNKFALTLVSFIICYLLGFIDFNFYVSIIYPILGFLNLFIFIFC